MREIKSDYMRGSINNIILHSLLEGDKYGYEIIKEVEERSNGQLKIKQPSLYSALNRLSDRGLIDGYVRDSAIGGKRRYFSLTELGREQLNSNKDAWVETRDSVDSYILNKPSEYQNIEVDKSPAASSMPKIVEAGKTGTSVETFGKKKPETAVTMVSFGEGKKPEVENLELSEDEINDMIDESLINHTQMSTHFEESFERLDDGALVKVKTKTTRIMCEEKVRSANNKVNITLIIANEDGIGAANDASEEDIDMILDALVTSDAKVRTHTAETLEKDGDKIYKIKTKTTVVENEKIGDFHFLTDDENIVQEPTKKHVIDKSMNDAAFVEDRLDFKDATERIVRKAEAKERGEFIDKYNLKEGDESQPLNYDTFDTSNEFIYTPTNEYSIYSSTRYFVENSSTHKPIKFINLYKLLFGKNMIMFAIGALQFLVVFLVLNNQGLIDYRTALVLFVTLYPLLLFFIAAIFKYTYNRNKKAVSKLVSPTIWIEAIFAVLSIVILYSLNRWGNIITNASMLPWGFLEMPHASWMFFGSLVFINLVLSAVIFNILKIFKPFKEN